MPAFGIPQCLGSDWIWYDDSISPYKRSLKLTVNNYNTLNGKHQSTHEPKHNNPRLMPHIAARLFVASSPSRSCCNCQHIRRRFQRPTEPCD
jgi:hypothetical protein